MNRTDERLVKDCQQGDETAWVVIVERYQNLIFSVPRRAGLNLDLASDVMQEVFCVLLEKLNDIEKPEFLRAWLMSTARHKTIRLIERELRDGRTSVEEMEEETLQEIPDKSVLPDDLLVKLEEEHLIQQALLSLEERCRKLLTFLYYEDEPKPYTEVAEILNIPLGSIGPTRARCLKKLAQLLQQ